MRKYNNNRIYGKEDKTLAEQAVDLQMGRVMPHDFETESDMLGALMTYSSSVISVANILKPSDFYLEKHGSIYSAILTIFQEGNDVGLLSVTRQLRKNGELEFCGGAQYLAKIVNESTIRELDKNALFLVELAKKRELIALGTGIVQKAYMEQTDVFDLVSEMQRGIVEILTFKLSKETDFGTIALKTWREIEEKKQGVLAGIPSKFNKTNELTGGYRRGTLRTIAGRPGMGKSLHLVNEAMFLSKEGYNVAVFSLEMPDKEVVKRCMSNGTQIEGWKLDKNVLTHDEILALQNFVIKAPDANIHIDDSGDIDILYLITQMKKIKFKNELKDSSKSGLDVVFIDYLQLMKLGNENRAIGLGEITRKLKSLSKEFDCCIVIYSQLSRAVETRGGDKRPQLSDLKESGSIEEDSDVVEFVYRAEYYGITENDKGESTVGIVEIITDKNRQGGKGTTELRFLPTVSTLLESRMDKKPTKVPDKPVSVTPEESINLFESGSKADF
jgi:replicative DNA helicase